jgi:hypothetical protein
MLPSDANTEGKSMYWRASSGGTSPGTLTVRSLGNTELVRRRFTAPVARFDRYDYRAPADIAGSLAEFDRYSAEVYTGTDGVRRFLPRPEDGLEGYIARAFQIGHSLLCRERRWDKQTFDRYCFGKLAFDWVRHARERLKPRRLTTEELVVPGRLRRDLLRRDALPDELADGDDRVRGAELVCRIAAAGAAAATTRGLDRPSETTVIALGLMDAAAGRPPLVPDAGQMAGLVRGALFDFDDDEDTISPEVWEEIGVEFEGGVRDRLHISQEQFNRWLYGEQAYMLQTVEKAAAPEVDEPRSFVRRAMLENAWRGFGQVSECLDAFARTFERAMLRPLNEREHRLYGVMYRRQPYFGGFVLPLLFDTADLLKYPVLDLWESPEDDRKIAVLQRMLLYRSEIVPRVREMQRRSRAAGGALVGSSSEERAVDDGASTWDLLMRRVLDERGIECSDCDERLICRVAKVTGDRSSFTVEVDCPLHGHLCRLKITAAEMTAAREALQGGRA